MDQKPPLMHFRSVFISDVHLGYHGCRAELLLSFLRTTRTENLYLVGDIVDLESLKTQFCWPQAHSDVIRTLLGKAKHGTRVVYIPGNHDHQFRDYCGLKFGNVEVRRRCLHTSASGQRYLVTHGDEFDCRVALNPALSRIGGWLYRQMMFLHSRMNEFRLRLGMGYWSLATFIKQRSGTAQRFIERYKDAVTELASGRRLDGVICGHIHRPESAHRNGIHYLNDGDWVENCTALVECSDGSFELLHWPRLLATLQSRGEFSLQKAA